MSLSRLIIGIMVKETREPVVTWDWMVHDATSPWRKKRNPWRKLTWQMSEATAAEYAAKNGMQLRRIEGSAKTFYPVRAEIPAKPGIVD